MNNQESNHLLYFLDIKRGVVVMKMKNLISINLALGITGYVLYGIEVLKTKDLERQLAKQSVNVTYWHNGWINLFEKANSIITSDEAIEHFDYMAEQLDFCYVVKSIRQEDYKKAMSDLDDIRSAYRY